MGIPSLYVFSFSFLKCFFCDLFQDQFVVVFLGGGGGGGGGGVQLAIDPWYACMLLR